MADGDASREGLPQNPLDALIDQMDAFYQALWNCHHAGTTEEKDKILAARHELTGLFWRIHHFPGDARRNVADPVIAWCRNKGCADSDWLAVVETAVEYMLALIRHQARALPTVYKNQDEAEEYWTKQGELLMQARAAWQELRRIAAACGEPWIRAADKRICANRHDGGLMKETNSGSARLGAARSVVELSTRVRETADLAVRLAELEQRLEQQEAKQR